MKMKKEKVIEIHSNPLRRVGPIRKTKYGYKATYTDNGKTNGWKYRAWVYFKDKESVENWIGFEFKVVRYKK